MGTLLISVFDDFYENLSMSLPTMIPYYIISVYFHFLYLKYNTKLPQLSSTSYTQNVTQNKFDYFPLHMH